MKYKVKDRWFEKAKDNNVWEEVIELEDGIILRHHFIWFGDQAMYAIDEDKSMSSEKRCSFCGGSGDYPACPKCNGEG